MNKNSNILETIRSQKGLSEFKALIERWETLSENIEKQAVRFPIILPDLFLTTKSGRGKTHCLKLLAEYLSERPNLMDFYGDVKYFEFLLNYCPPREPFSEIQRFMSEVSAAAGFRSLYRGIVCIDIDEWRNHCEEKYFLSFMEYLADNSDDWLVVFSLPDDHKEENDRMETIVSAFLRTERIRIEAPKNDELMQYLSDCLAEYELELSEDAMMLLSDSIRSISRSKYFDSYKTVRMICRDIAYTAYTNGNCNGALDAESLSSFSNDSEYIKKMIYKFEKVNKIGFN